MQLDSPSAVAEHVAAPRALISLLAGRDRSCSRRRRESNGRQIMRTAAEGTRSARHSYREPTEVPLEFFPSFFLGSQLKFN